MHTHIDYADGTNDDNNDDNAIINIGAYDLPAPWCFLHTTFCTVHTVPRAHKRPE